MEGIWLTVAMFTVITTSGMSVSLHPATPLLKSVLPAKQPTVMEYVMSTENSTIHRVRRDPEPTIGLINLLLSISDPKVKLYKTLARAGRQKRSPFMQLLPAFVRENQHMMAGIQHIERASNPIGRHRKIVSKV